MAPAVLVGAAGLAHPAGRCGEMDAHLALAPPEGKAVSGRPAADACRAPAAEALDHVRPSPPALPDRTPSRAPLSRS